MGGHHHLAKQLGSFKIKLEISSKAELLACKRTTPRPSTETQNPIRLCKNVNGRIIRGS